MSLHGGIQIRPVLGIPAGVAPETDIPRASEHAFVGGEPFEPQNHGDLEGLVGDRPFRRPKSRRRLSENAFMERARPHELLSRILRVAKRGCGSGVCGFATRAISVSHKSGRIGW